MDNPLELNDAMFHQYIVVFVTITELTAEQYSPFQSISDTEMY